MGRYKKWKTEEFHCIGCEREWLVRYGGKLLPLCRVCIAVMGVFNKEGGESNEANEKTDSDA